MHQEGGGPAGHAVVLTDELNPLVLIHWTEENGPPEMTVTNEKSGAQPYNPEDPFGKNGGWGKTFSGSRKFSSVADVVGYWRDESTRSPPGHGARSPPEDRDKPIGQPYSTLYPHPHTQSRPLDSSPLAYRN